MRPLTRRQFLAQTGGLLALASSPTWAAPKAKSKIRDVARGPKGTTILMELENAPFPHRGSRYKDPSVWVFIPHHFRVHRDMRVDAVIHFHGFRDTAEDAMKRHQLREQLWASKQNAIIVFPQGPVRANDQSGGKLDEKNGYVQFLTELRETLQTPSLQSRLGAAGIPSRARIGKTIISCHSGGFKVAANCVEHGGWNVNEVYLFDALYGSAEVFKDYLLSTYFSRKSMEERHKVISFYSGAQTEVENKRLMRMLQQAKVGVQHETVEGSSLTKTDLTRSRAVFIKTRSNHDRVLFSTHALRDCLYASCLTRYLKSDWFKTKDQPRLAPSR